MVSFGPASSASERCGFWLNSPTPGHVQIACYTALNPIPVHNAIETISLIGTQGNWTFPDGAITWLIKPGAFELVGAASDQIEVKLVGIF